MAVSRLAGFANLGYFPLTANTDTTYTPGTRAPLVGAYTCTKTDNKTVNNIPADDNPAWETNSTWEDTTKQKVNRIILEDLASLQGSTITEGVLTEGVLDSQPQVALNFSAKMAKGGYRCYRYYSAEMVSAQVNHQTQSSDNTTQDYTLEFRCKARPADGNVRTTTDVDDLDQARTWLATIPAIPATP